MGGTMEIMDKAKVALVYNNRGHTRYKQVQFEEALDDYFHAICLNPNFAVAYYNRGTITYRLCAAMPEESGERQAMCTRAKGDFSEAARLDPENPEFREALNNCRDIPRAFWTGSPFPEK
ncbi:tetratricopeptide repeat protein 32-like isoform X2 [Penaeus indicus]|uniref:tetratricopeptide repeat protein 32-like isoform X2 n=1 Tax=Penaeus indicus TaxID=29960 RepID=UPI00300C2CCB